MTLKTATAIVWLIMQPLPALVCWNDDAPAAGALIDSQALPPWMAETNYDLTIARRYLNVDHAKATANKLADKATYDLNRLKALASLPDLWPEERVPDYVYSFIATIDKENCHAESASKVTGIIN